MVKCCGPKRFLQNNIKQTDEKMFHHLAYLKTDGGTWYLSHDQKECNRGLALPGSKGRGFPPWPGSLACLTDIAFHQLSVSPFQAFSLPMAMPCPGKICAHCIAEGNSCRSAVAGWEPAAWIHGWQSKQAFTTAWNSSARA